ncbi:hypothetical protein HMI56_006003, partial [Coelomomyces lativittatus]
TSPVLKAILSVFHYAVEFSVIPTTDIEKLVNLKENVEKVIAFISRALSAISTTTSHGTLFNYHSHFFESRSSPFTPRLFSPHSKKVFTSFLFIFIKITQKRYLPSFYFIIYPSLFIFRTTPSSSEHVALFYHPRLKFNFLKVFRALNAQKFSFSIEF